MLGDSRLSKKKSWQKKKFELYKTDNSFSKRKWIIEYNFTFCYRNKLMQMCHSMAREDNNIMVAYNICKHYNLTENRYPYSNEHFLRAEDELLPLVLNELIHIQNNLYYMHTLFFTKMSIHCCWNNRVSLSTFIYFEMRLLNRGLK